MKCFGDKTKTFHCKVVLLDEQELIQEVQETTTGQDLLDVVYKHLNLIETAYFGLRYIDPSNQTHWLDPNKRLAKQLRGASPYTLYFSVKFYAADPTKLVEEITRYQFFLQIKQDILQGRLPISSELAAELGSYAVQSELGDYDPRRHSPGYVSEFRFCTSQSVDLENKIAELHKKLVSYVPSKAEMSFLEKVKWLDMYGVDLHSVLGEDSTEYFLGLTPSGIIVLRNKAKVGNYFWPRITKVYFRGRFFMLRVKDKNNVENTYGFETPSKSACKHLWQCCVEHHAFFRLTQTAGNSPQAIFSLGSKYRYNGRTEKEALNEAQMNVRPQTEFARTPSRRYQRRIVEGAQDTPRAEEVETKPETRTVVSLPGTVTPVSHVYRSTSLTLSPRSDSPRSTRSAPHPSGLQRQNLSTHAALNSSTTKREGRLTKRGESPRSVKSASAGRATEEIERIPRRTSSVESQSSADSRSCNRSCSRHRRSRCRSSDGESEASSRCSSSKGGHRRHHHRHHHHRHRSHSGDSPDHHKRRHRRHRHKSNDKEEPQMIESSGQWERIQCGETPAKSNTATVRDLTSGYMPSGHDDTELDTSVQHHSSRRKHKKHRSPSDSKHKATYPDEIRRHIDFSLQNSEGLTEAELRDIPYTRVETAKNVKIRYGSPKGKRHKSPKRSKSNSVERKSQPSETQLNLSSPVPNETSIEKSYPNGSVNEYNGGSFDRGRQDKTIKENGAREPETQTVNGSARPCPRSSLVSAGMNTPTDSVPLEERATSAPSFRQTDSSPLSSFPEGGTLQRHRRERRQSSPPLIYGPKSGAANGLDKKRILNGNSKSCFSNQYTYTQEQSQYSSNSYNTNNGINNSNITYENSQSPYQHQNRHSGGVFLQPPRDSGQIQSPSILYAREDEEGEMSSGFIDSNNGVFMRQSQTHQKNATLERGSHFATLKPQPSPQSSVTSGISIGSSSVSISNDSSLTRSSRSFHPSSNDFPSPSQSQDLSPPSSSPDPELHTYDDSKQVTPIPRSSKSLNGEPFYMNAKVYCPVHSNQSDVHTPLMTHNHYENGNITYPNGKYNHGANDPVTQHSTNILIHYHDGNNSSGSSGYKTPTPTPRSSIISSIHSSDTSTHIVQSYAPAYANSRIVNSHKRSSLKSVPSRPLSSLSTHSFQPSVNCSTEATFANYSSLPRTVRSKPSTITIGSQTNVEQYVKLEHDVEINQNISVKDKIAFLEQRAKPLQSTKTTKNLPKTKTFESNSEICTPRSVSCSSRNALKVGDGNEGIKSFQRDTNQSSNLSNTHWKVYNWDTGRNEENWTNSLSHSTLPQEMYNGQRSGDGAQFTRRGSAGSLDLILSPLIQSALEHQQR